VLEIVTATRLSERDFWTKSPLGLSLKRIHYEGRIAVFLTVENRRGLPDIYNERILAPTGMELLAFVHDDVWVDDYFLVDHVAEGLKRFDVIGVAGNRRRVPKQVAWACKADRLAWDDRANLSGSIATGSRPFGPVSYYGPVPAECELLDGVFLAAKKSSLTANGVTFDPRFSFHFYDMDFCRSARSQGLRLGTWPVCLTHQSNGKFGSPSWAEKYALYLEKWKE